MNLGIFYVALSGILYGSIGFSGHHLMALGFSVNALLFWRFFLSTLVLFPFSLRYFAGSPRKSVDLKMLALLFAFSGVFYGIGTAAYFEASKSVGTGLAMVIFFSYPLVVVCLSRFLHKEPFRATTIGSLAFILMGLSMIALGDAARFEIVGVTLATISGFLFGCYVFFSKRICRAIPSVFASFVVCLANTLAFTIYAGVAEQAITIPTGLVTWLHLGFFSLFGTVLPVMFLFLGLKTVSANKASIISVLEPVTTLAVGAWLLQEKISVLQFVGACVILAGALLVQLGKEKHEGAGVTAAEH
jgi:drug/metabolite transporter (DMT)-like permease